MQVSGVLQGRPGPCAHRGAWILGNEIGAQPSDNGISVVFVQTVEGQAVVEEDRRLLEDLASHLEVYLWPGLGFCLCVARN